MIHRRRVESKSMVGIEGDLHCPSLTVSPSAESSEVVAAEQEWL